MNDYFLTIGKIIVGSGVNKSGNQRSPSVLSSSAECTKSRRIAKNEVPPSAIIVTLKNKKINKKIIFYSYFILFLPMV